MGNTKAKSGCGFSGSVELTQAQSGLFLTSQEKAFCKGVAQGQPPEMVARNLGMARNTWIELMERADIVETLGILKMQVDQFMGVEVTRDLLNAMLFEAHATADCSNAKISSIRELGKMNGTYAADKVSITDSRVTKIEHLESLTDEELTRRADLRVKLKNDCPQEITDANFEEVEKVASNE